MSDSNTQNIESGDLSLKEVIHIIKDYLGYFKRNILWIILAGLLGMAALAGSAYIQGSRYKAGITFIVNEKDSNSSISLPTSLGNFGFGGKQFEIASLEKILMLSKSENILFSLLLSKLDGKETLIINRLIELYLPDAELTHVSNDDFSKLSIDEKRSLRFVAVHFLKKNPELLNTSYDEESQVFKIISITDDEELSYNLAKILYSKLISFYKGHSIKKAQNAVSTLEHRKDSVVQVLNKGEYELALMVDRGSNYIYNTSAVSRYRKKREVEVNTKLYLEVEGLLEVARYKLEGVTPIFTTIDAPYYPLRVIGIKLVENAIIGLFIGLGLILLFLILLKGYQDIMNEG